MQTGLEINLQVALMALGLATVMGIYLYSRFRDRSIADSKNEPIVTNEFESISRSDMASEEYQTNLDVPDYLTGIESDEISSDNPFEVPEYESINLQHSENEHTDNIELYPSEDHQPIHDFEINNPDEDESDTPVLVEQIDLAEIVDDMTDETIANDRLDDTNNPYLSDSSTEYSDEDKPEMTTASVYSNNLHEKENSEEMAIDLSDSSEQEIELPQKEEAKKRKSSKRFEIFNRFRKPESNLDTDQDEGQFDFEYDHEIDEPEACSTHIIGEYGEFEPPNRDISENLEEITQARFEYPEIQGFNRLGQIDYWVKFQGGSEFDKDTLETLYRKLFGTLKNPTQLYGMRTIDHEWVNVLHQPDQDRFVTLIVSLQLVDSSGAISRNELNKFTDGITQFSKKLEKDLIFMAPLESAFKQSLALSNCVKLFDSTNMVFVVPDREGHKIHGQEIEFCANQIGLEPYKTNYYVRTKRIQKKQMILYGVANMSNEGTFDFDNMVTLNSQGLVFFFRPIFHQAPGSVFSEMVSTAKSFAGRIGAKAMTPEGDELTVSMTSEIRAKIEKQSREMAICGLKSGDNTILRIFESEIFVSD